MPKLVKCDAKPKKPILRLIPVGAFVCPRADDEPSCCGKWRITVDRHVFVPVPCSYCPLTLNCIDCASLLSLDLPVKSPTPHKLEVQILTVKHGGIPGDNHEN